MSYTEISSHPGPVSYSQQVAGYVLENVAATLLAELQGTHIPLEVNVIGRNHY